MRELFSEGVTKETMYKKTPPERSIPHHSLHRLRGGTHREN